MPPTFLAPYNILALDLIVGNLSCTGRSSFHQLAASFLPTTTSFPSFQFCTSLPSITAKSETSVLTMAKTSLPPGFRFHPTDVELTVYYLKRKLLGKHLRCNAITEIDLYKFAPWDLPGIAPQQFHLFLCH